MVIIPFFGPVYLTKYLTLINVSLSARLDFMLVSSRSACSFHMKSRREVTWGNRNE